MKTRKSAIVLGLLAVLAAGSAFVRAEDFPGDRMRAGKDLYRAKRYPEAADQFRIAGFGLLDDPRRLLESLGRLALAQDAIRPPVDLGPVIARIVDVERRFAVFATADFEPDIRSEIGKLILLRVPEATLAGIPGFSGLIETPEQRIAKLPAKDRVKALESAARREPGAARWPLALCRLALESGDARSLEEWSGRALEIAPGDREALAFRAHARALRSKCREALVDLGALSEADFQRRPELRADDFVCRAAVEDWKGAEEALDRLPADAASRNDVAVARRNLAKRKSAAEREKPSAAAAPPPAAPAPSAAPPPAPGLSDVRRLLAAGKAGDAEAMARRLLEADPSRRDLRLALLEAACLARDFRAAADQVASVVPFGEGEAPFEFYSAVVLYETGRVADARKHLEHARPRIVATPYTDYYARKILGS